MTVLGVKVYTQLCLLAYIEDGVQAVGHKKPGHWGCGTNGDEHIGNLLDGSENMRACCDLCVLM